MEKQAGQNPDIRIYVVCHKPAYVPENPYLYPIQVGTALSGKKLPGMLRNMEIRRSPRPGGTPLLRVKPQEFISAAV